MIIVVAGVAGCGKTTVGRLLSGRLGWPFADGDSFHPARNVAKMRSGIPLTDEDRWPWLQAIAAWMDGRASGGDSAVVACSALKRSYRALLRSGRPEVHIVLLQIPPAVLAERLKARHGHFFPRALLESQVADLEPPAPDEPILEVPADRPPATVVDDIVARLRIAGHSAA
jgi:gluconokinase